MVDDVLALAEEDTPENDEERKAKAMALVTATVDKQKELEDTKASLELKLSQCNIDLKEVQERTLPDAMIDAGLKKFETTDGDIVSLGDVCYTSFVKDDELEVFDWMVENKHQGMISGSVVIPLGKGGYEEAKEISDKLKLISEEDDPEELQKIVSGIKEIMSGVPVTVKGEIHWSTLRAWGGEQVRNQKDSDDEDQDKPIVHEKIKLSPTKKSKIKRKK